MSSGAPGCVSASSAPAANRAHERRALDQLVARRDEKTALRLRADPVAGTSDALQRDGDRARRAELHDEVDRADIDAELERSRRDDRAQLAGLQALLGVEARLAREAAVMRQHEAFAEPLVERERDALAHAARSDEDQRRAMRSNLLGDAIVDLAPHLFARNAAPARRAGPRRESSISRR